jgi:hypothetical protein
MTQKGNKIQANRSSTTTTVIPRSLQLLDIAATAKDSLQAGLLTVTHKASCI